jgi:predicted small metal-binding protein
MGWSDATGVDLAVGRCGIEELGAHGHEAVETSHAGSPAGSSTRGPEQSRNGHEIEQDRRSAGHPAILGWRDTSIEISRKGTRMKVMTCQQLGGPCEFELKGATADEVIKAQDRHLKKIVAEGDATHDSAFKDMKGRWKRPISGIGWYRQVKRDFAALPEA